MRDAIKGVYQYESLSKELAKNLSSALIEEIDTPEQHEHAKEYYCAISVMLQKTGVLLKNFQESIENSLSTSSRSPIVGIVEGYCIKGLSIAPQLKIDDSSNFEDKIDPLSKKYYKFIKELLTHLDEEIDFLIQVSASNAELIIKNLSSNSDPIDSFRPFITDASILALAELYNEMTNDNEKIVEAIKQYHELYTQQILFLRESTSFLIDGLSPDNIDKIKEKNKKLRILLNSTPIVVTKTAEIFLPPVFPDQFFDHVESILSIANQMYVISRIEKREIKSLFHYMNVGILPLPFFVVPYISVQIGYILVSSHQAMEFGNELMDRERVDVQ